MFCPRCGAQSSIANQAFCQKCGAAIDGRYTVTPGALAAGVAVSADPYAEFWRRLGGFIIDWFVSAIAAAMLVFVVVSLAGKSASAAGLPVLVYVVAFWL